MRNACNGALEARGHRLSLADLESLELAKRNGLHGRPALKARKGQSQALLMAAAAQKDKMFASRFDASGQPRSTPREFGGP